MTRTQRALRGYILIETIVSMGILSISMVTVHQSLRDAVLMRGLAQDYTTARFLLEEVASERELQVEMRASSGKGVFEAPYERFSYRWYFRKVKVPSVTLPPWIQEHQLEDLMSRYKGYMGKLEVTVSWERAGQPYDAKVQTLLLPEKLWTLVQ